MRSRLKKLQTFLGRTWELIFFQERSLEVNSTIKRHYSQIVVTELGYTAIATCTKKQNFLVAILVFCICVVASYTLSWKNGYAECFEFILKSNQSYHEKNFAIAKTFI